MRSIGMDVHRSFAQIAVVEGGICRDEGRIGVTPEALGEWAATLGPGDEVVLEATTNSDAIAMLLTPLVARVVVDFLPAVWLPDDRIRMLRRLVHRRTHLVRQRTRLKNQVHAILARNLVPTCPHSDLFGGVGCRWLAQQVVPVDEQRSVTALLRQLEFHGTELDEVERDIAIEAIDDPVVARLMTVPGIDVAVAVSVLAAVGDFSRFDDPNRLVSYLGLNPRVRQSGDRAASHGRITKAGRSQARGMLVEAAFAASRSPGPLRAFYKRIKNRRGFQVAIVATARKMTVLCWHLVTKDQDYAFARPGLSARKRRNLELAAGHPTQIAKRGAAYNYNDPEFRRREREFVEQQEHAYEVMVAHWQPQKPASTG